MNDARVPSWVKIAIPLVVLLYFVMPVDFIPDFIPGLGQLDDLGVLLIGMSLVIRFSPPYVVDEHKMALGYEAGGTAGSAGTAAGTANGASGGQATRKMSGDGEAIDGEYKVVRPEENL